MWSVMIKMIQGLQFLEALIRTLIKCIELDTMIVAQAANIMATLTAAPTISSNVNMATSIIHIITRLKRIATATFSDRIMSPTQGSILPTITINTTVAINIIRTIIETLAVTILQITTIIRIKADDEFEIEVEEN